MKDLKLIIVADIKEYLPLLMREEITHSKFAQLLNEDANKALRAQGIYSTAAKHTYSECWNKWLETDDDQAFAAWLYAETRKEYDTQFKDDQA
jgi:ferritin